MTGQSLTLVPVQLQKPYATEMKISVGCTDDGRVALVTHDAFGGRIVMGQTEAVALAIELSAAAEELAARVAAAG